MEHVASPASVPPRPASRRMCPLPGLPGNFSASEDLHTPSTVTSSSPRIGLPIPGRQGSLFPEDREDVIVPAESTRYPAPQAEDRPRTEWKSYSDHKIPQYQCGEDFENYLLRFERIAKTWRWPEDEWACRLVSLLSGKALEAYSAMDQERAHCYIDLQAALLANFDISPPYITYIVVGYDLRSTRRRRLVRQSSWSNS